MRGTRGPRLSPGKRAIRQQLYERYHSGDAVRLAGTFYNLYDRDFHVERIFEMLDGLEVRESTGGKSL